MVTRTREPGPFGLSGIGSRGEPAAVTDVLTIENVSVPEFASPGSTIPVQVTVGCAAPLFTDCEAALRVSTPQETVRVPQSGTMAIGEAQNHTFSPSVTMTSGDMSITIEALEAGDATGVINVEDQTSTVVSSATQTEALARNWGPWVGGGAIVGLGGAALTDRDMLMGAGVGAGAGLVGRVAFRQFPNINIPNIGLVELAAGGTVLILGLVLVDRVTSEDVPGFGAVLETTGDVARGVGGTAKSAIDQAR